LQNVQSRQNAEGVKEMSDLKEMIDLCIDAQKKGRESALREVAEMARKTADAHEASARYIFSLPKLAMSDFKAVNDHRAASKALRQLAEELTMKVEISASTAEDEACLVIDEIRQERFRQIHQEGWTAAHDDEHERGELALAAAAYALAKHDRSAATNLFPFEKWWLLKPTTYRRYLVKAGACIVAEIERLDRAGEEENGA
jgi:hypothetical protein